MNIAFLLLSLHFLLCACLLRAFHAELCRIRYATYYLNIHSYDRKSKEQEIESRLSPVEEGGYQTQCRQFGQYYFPAQTARTVERDLPFAHKQEYRHLRGTREVQQGVCRELFGTHEKVSNGFTPSALKQAFRTNKEFSELFS